ncbi:MAG: NADH-quinone oxidoreductase subunit NuoE [Gammaproteobacteria bacterium]|nr:MAG: NADH-quinone oxidoreductase subunit NuoE [Gammaproteobacteria bacterium]
MSSQILSRPVLDAIAEELQKYPSDHKQSAVMAALRFVQEEKNWISREAMDAIADVLGMQPIQVYEVATFYSMYRLKNSGRHQINVCTNVSCMLCGSSEVVSHLQDRLGIKPGQTTSDGRFSLNEVECLGACGGAPMMQLDRDYHENLTPEILDALLEGLD